MKRALLLGVLAACTGEGNQVVIQLDGPVMARRVEILFVEPLVFIKRDQRANTPPILPVREPAFYVVQRRRIDLVFEGTEMQPVDDVELQLVGADNLVPIAIAHDEQDAIVGVGILDPESVFRDDGENPENFLTNLRELADITKFPITIEPVDEMSSIVNPAQPPVSVAIGEARVIRCADQQVPSGLVWRPQTTEDGIRPQLRIVQAFDDVDAFRRVEREGFDLDCDGSTPATLERGIKPDDGDGADCDDIAAIVHGGNVEPASCDGIDSDCDANTMGAEVIRGQCGVCAGVAGNRVTCVEGLGANVAIDNNGCSKQSDCISCTPHTQLDLTGHVGCSNIGELPIPGGCGADCVIRVVAVDPRWDVKIGEPSNPQRGMFEGYKPTSQKMGISITPVGNPLPQFQAGDADYGGVTLTWQTSPTADVFVLDIPFLANPMTLHNDGNVCVQLETMPPCLPSN